jgi:hypothetical protein
MLYPTELPGRDEKLASLADPQRRSKSEVAKWNFRLAGVPCRRAFVVFVVWQQFNDARGFVEKEYALGVAVMAP